MTIIAESDYAPQHAAGSAVAEAAYAPRHAIEDIEHPGPCMAARVKIILHIRAARLAS